MKEVETVTDLAVTATTGINDGAGEAVEQDKHRGATEQQKQNSTSSISAKKLAANRSNGKRSRGPKTERGKRRSRRNRITHGILTSVLLIRDGDGKEDAADFAGLYTDLRRDLGPVGALEVMLVESIAVAFWRARRALQGESGMIRHSFASRKRRIDWGHYQPNAEQKAINEDDLRLPDAEDLNRILRYEASNNRQLASLLNQLDRVQRAREEKKPEPPAVQGPTDQ